MTQQPNMEEILCDYLDGTLDAKRRQAVETLLKHDAKLRKTLAAMQQVHGVLRDLPIETMPVAAANSLQEQLRPPAEPSIPLYSPKWLIRLAAAFAIAVTVGLIIWSALPPPMDQRTVAMNSVSSPAVQSVAFDTKKDSAVAKLGDTMEPSLATRAGGAEQLRADEAASENEPTLMVVVANDIGGTEREIRNLLTLNNINYESVPASAAERVEAAKEVQSSGGRSASDAALDTAAPAPAEAQADLEKSKVKIAPSVSAAPAAAAPSAATALPAPGETATPSAAPPLAQSARAAGAGGGGQGMAGGSRRDMAQAFASAKPTAQPFGAAPQRRSQTSGGRTASEPYGMVVARNVTPDQLGKIRSGLRDASRAGKMRVVDPSVNRVTQAQTYRKQALDRNEQTDLNQRQVQTQSPWQYSNSQAIQNTQELAPQNTTQPPISYSARYDVTIVVQGEGAAADIPTWPAPATTSNSTLPSTNPTIP